MGEIFVKYSPGAKEVIKRIKDNGYSAYIVGGAVRDYILGRKINDFDICTNALPTTISDIFINYKVINTGIKHGTVTIIIGKEKIEVTTFRIDGGYDDHRRPRDVSFIQDLYGDLRRRDFTINSLAYDENIIDYFGGVSDIKNGIIRTIIEPYVSFSDDALRILRALRFSSVLGFEISKDTSEAIHKYFILLNNISKERIIDELFKMIVGEYYYDTFEKYYDVFNYLFDINYSNEMINKIANGFKNICDSDIILRLCLLFYYYNIDSLGSLLKKYHFSNAYIREIIDVCSLKDEKYSNEIDVRRLLKNYDFKTVKKAIYLKSFLEKEFNFSEKMNILEEVKFKCNTLKELKVSGNDLLSLGIEQKKIGPLLDMLLEEIINNRIENDKNILLETVKKKGNIC